MSIIALAAGAVTGIVSDMMVARRVPRHRLPLAAAVLVGAAVVYPLARRGGSGSSEIRQREWGAVAVAAGVALAATRVSERNARLLVAAGWAAHGGFDFLHDRGPNSKLPGWYPAFCAGYDAALAAALLSRPL